MPLFPVNFVLMHIVSLSQVLLWMEQYRYWVIFPLAVIEGPIVTIIGAFLVSQGYLNAITLFLVAFSGDMVGDSLYYAFGRYLYGHLSERFERRFRKTGELIRRTVGYLRENPWKTILLGKWTQGAGLAILIGSGAAQVPIRKFLAYCALWTVPKLVVFMSLGYFFGSAYARIDTYIGQVSLFGFVLLVVVIVAFYLHDKPSSAWKR